jgi:hypothetical protein
VAGLEAQLRDAEGRRDGLLEILRRAEALAMEGDLEVMMMMMMMMMIMMMMMMMMMEVVVVVAGLEAQLRDAEGRRDGLLEILRRAEALAMEGDLEVMMVVVVVVVVVMMMMIMMR